MAFYDLFKQSPINEHLHFFHLIQYYHEDFYMYILALLLYKINPSSGNADSKGTLN